MLYLLDTGPLAGLLHERPGAIELIRPWLIRAEVVTSILVYGETHEYILGRENSDQRISALRDLVSHIIPLDLTLEIMDLYGTIRRLLRPPNGPGLIGDIDTLIAATGLEHGLTIVSTDSDFRRVPGLKVRILEPRTFAPFDGDGQ